MALKDINIFEQHVEKIVLAVAAAGALYLGSMAIQPVTVAEKPDLPVDKVETELAKSIEALNATEGVNMEKGKLTPTMENYAARYKDLIGRQPLAANLLRPEFIPVFGPVNMGVRGGAQTPDLDPLYQLVTPSPVTPESLSAEAWQQPVATVAPAVPGGAPPAPGAVPLPVHDQNAVVIQGYIPVAKMVAEMASQKTVKTAIPQAMQRVAIYRIEVQRRDLLPNGGWSGWKDVPPTKATVAPTELDFKAMSEAGVDPIGAMDTADQEFKQIVLPDFYPDAQGVPIQPPVLTKPAPKNITEKSSELAKELAKATGVAAPAAAAPKPYVVPSAQPVETSDLQGNLITGGGAVATPGVQMNADVAAIKGQPLVPFTFWDETVEPDHHYLYRVRVRVINPTFNWRGGLKTASMKDVPTLDSPWVEVNNAAAPVVVNADVAFFVTSTSQGGAGRANRANVRVFKRNSGKWYWSEFSPQPGMSISGQVRLVDIRPAPTIDVDTGYTVIDVTTGGDSRVVLKDPFGNLITREVATDAKDGQYIRLLADAAKPAVAPPSTNPVNPGTGRGRGLSLPNSGGGSGASNVFLGE